MPVRCETYESPTDVQTTALGSLRTQSATALLLTLLMLPTGLFYLGLIPSMGIGTALPALGCWLLWKSRNGGAIHFQDAPKLTGQILCVVTIHLALAAMSAPVDLARGISSLFLLLASLAGAFSLAELLSRATSKNIHLGVMRSLHLMGLSALLGALAWLQPDISSFGKSVFPFTEPSHLALCAAPLLIYACVQTPRPFVRLLYLMAALAATAALQNLTMALICLLIAALCLPLRYLSVLLVIPASAIFLNLDLSYYADRLDFSDNSQNLSALVFLQGWLLISESWDAAGFLGRGFQQLGIFGTDVYTDEIIQLLNNDTSMNLLDGGFVLSKLLSEFGLIGAILAISYVREAWKCTLWLRRHVNCSDRDRQPAVLVLAACSICAYSVELMVRGAGYFTPSGILFVASLWIWTRRQQHPAPASSSTAIQSI